MRIVTFAKLQIYILKHSDSDIALREWFNKTKLSKWSCFADIKKSFNSVDSIGNNRFVFNIKGNKYRLVAIIIFASQKVYIRFIGTHAEYNKTDCKNI